MKGSARSRISFLIGIPAILAAAGCTVAAVPGIRPPAPLSAVEQTEVLPMLRIEDERSRAIDPVLSATTSASPAVRARAALSLGRLRAPEAHDALIDLLQDGDTAVAATAAFSLGQLGDTAAAAHLAHVLEHSGALRITVAAEAAYALGKLRSAASARALSDFLATREVGARTPVEPVASALLATWRHPRPADLDFITRWTAAPDPELRWRAGYALVRRPTPAAATLMQRLAGDADARVRAMAMRGLTLPLADSAGIGTAALPLVLAGAEDPDYAVRVNAVRTLGTYSAPASLELLSRLVRGGDRHLAVVAAEALGRLGAAAGSVAGTLSAVALDPAAPSALRQTALESLVRVERQAGRVAAEQAANALEWRVRVGAARALAGSGGEARDAAERLARDPDGRVAAAALQALTDVAGDTLATLRSLLVESLQAGDMAVRTAAINGLGRLADPATFPLLLDAYERALRDEENDAQLAALDAIARFERPGATPARAFFARFPRSGDYLVRLRARERFGDAGAAWGDPLPLQPRAADYAELLSRAQLPGGPRVRIETDQGSIELLLSAADAPLTVENFLGLVRAGYFDGQEWPRVVPNFVVQGGDPRGDTSGGPGYSIRDEFNRRRYSTGTLGMALSGPDTGGSQWFITHSPQPHLDGAYTVFGEVVSGQEVTERILPGDRIRRIHVLP
jgi:cyclophilin family peptidyl-prolyl cis-trans isomerase/HEAT repeat protein